MKRTRCIASLCGALVFASFSVAFGSPSQTDAVVDADDDDDAAAERRRRLDAWQEALELDLPAEVLDGARAWPGGDAALSQDGEAQLLVALALASTGRVDDARERLATIDGDAHARAVAELAALDVDADRLADALERLAREDGALRAELADEPRAHYQLGRALVRGGDLAAARGPLEDFVERWPWHRDAPAAWHMLSQEALARRDLDRARVCREKTAEFGRWHAFYRTRRLQRRAAPDAPEPRVGLAQLWIAAGDYARAADELAPVLTQHPDYCLGWTTLGELERKRAEVAAARDAYERALACDPTEPLPRFAAAMLALEAGDSASARTHLERLCASPAASEERYVRAHLELARILAAADETDAANERYARYRALGGTEPLDASSR